MIEVLRDTPARRRIAVLGEMLELGNESGRLHREIGRFAAEQGIDVVIGVRGAARCIVEGAVERGLARPNAMFFASAEKAGELLAGFLQPGDVALFKGSRGVAVEKALERVLHAAS
jgi:UDP-N-acetylmuramoyl-tripeptide--D-alanyl-D-alanine ligase